MHFHGLAVLEADKVRSLPMDCPACGRDGRAGSQLQVAAVRTYEVNLCRHLVFGDGAVCDRDLDIREGGEPALQILADGIFAAERLRAAYIMPDHILRKDCQCPFHIVCIPGSDFFLIVLKILLNGHFDLLFWSMKMDNTISNILSEVTIQRFADNVTSLRQVLKHLFRRLVRGWRIARKCGSSKRQDAELCQHGLCFCKSRLCIRGKRSLPQRTL